MSSRTIPGQTCRVCRTELTAASANCPSYGKLDMARLRAEAVRAFLPAVAFATSVFSFLAVATAYVNGPAIISGLAGHIDDPFKPPAIKKK